MLPGGIGGLQVIRPVIALVAGLACAYAAMIAPAAAEATVVASRTITLPATGERIRVQAVRTREGFQAAHRLRLQRRVSGRFRTVDTVWVTGATPQPGGRDFCGLRIVSRSARSVRLSYCAMVTASIGRVRSKFTATRSRLSPE